MINFAKKLWAEVKASCKKAWNWISNTTPGQAVGGVVSGVVCAATTLWMHVNTMPMLVTLGTGMNTLTTTVLITTLPTWLYWIGFVVVFSTLMLAIWFFTCSIFNLIEGWNKPYFTPTNVWGVFAY